VVVARYDVADRTRATASAPGFEVAWLYDRATVRQLEIEAARGAQDGRGAPEGDRETGPRPGDPVSAPAPGRVDPHQLETGGEPRRTTPVDRSTDRGAAGPRTGSDLPTGRATGQSAAGPKTGSDLPTDRPPTEQGPQTAEPAPSTQIDLRLVDSVRRTYVLERKGGYVTVGDLRRLARAGFSDIGFDCVIGAMGDGETATVGPSVENGGHEVGRGVSADAERVAPSGRIAERMAPSGRIAQRSGDGGAGDPALRGLPVRRHARWHSARTGASRVVPAFLRRLEGRGARPVRVAVVDSGIDPERLNPGLELVKEGASFVAAAGGGTPWLVDPLGHGTAVASLIQEVAGPYGEIVSIRVLDEKGRGTQSALARGILAAVVDHHARIVNLSLGYHAQRGGSGLPPYLVDALAAAYNHGARVYAAAGNSCRGPDPRACQEFFPAAAPWSIGDYTLGVTSVSGLRPDGRPSTQVVGRPVDVWAPSEFICARTSRAASGAGFQQLSGSSFAVPQVAGALALLIAWQEHNLGRSLTVPELTRLQDILLIESARDHLPFDREPVQAGRPPGVAERPPCGPGSHEGSILHGTPGGRLNLCNVAAAMGVTVDDCATWTDGPADPGADRCPIEPSSPVAVSVRYEDGGRVGCCGYAEGGGYRVVEADGGPDGAIEPGRTWASAEDQRCSAVWCGHAVHSAPSTPVCTSCQYCIVSPSQFKLNLRLAPEAGSFTAYQLRVTAATGRDFYFPLGNLSGLAGQAVAYQGGFSPTLPPGDPSDVWLIATDRAGGAWSGAPLLRTQCN
jgi:hypothetical protein